MGQLVYLVGLRDYPPEAVFSTLEAAQAYLSGGDDHVYGPYEIDAPDAEHPNWFEAEDAATT